MSQTISSVNVREPHTGGGPRVASAPAPGASEPAASPARGSIRAGHALKGLLAAFLLLDATLKVLRLAPAMEGTARVGYPTSAVLPLGLVLLACTLVYVVPRTSALGAILLTGYLGGATATHVRMGEPFVIPVVFGVLVWAALYASDARIRALVPLRR